MNLTGAMMISISATLFNVIKDHASRDYPNECCGGIIGRVDHDMKIIEQIIPIDNNWDDTLTENKRRRFRVTDSDYQYLEKMAAKHQLLLLGFYHSHPDHPAEPSKTDLSFAWPFFSYPIISVEKGKPSIIRSFVLNVDTNSFQEEDFQINS